MWILEVTKGTYCLHLAGLLQAFVGRLLKRRGSASESNTQKEGSHLASLEEVQAQVAAGHSSQDRDGDVGGSFRRHTHPDPLDHLGHLDHLDHRMDQDQDLADPVG